MGDRVNRGREGYRKPKREGWEVGEIKGNYKCFIFCNRKRAKERKSRKRVRNRECKVRESDRGGDLSNLVNASRL